MTMKEKVQSQLNMVNWKIESCDREVADFTSRIARHMEDFNVRSAGHLKSYADNLERASDEKRRLEETKRMLEYFLAE